MPPAQTPIPAVVTVHDLTHLHYYTHLHCAYYNVVLRRFFRRCRAIICVSEYTRNEFLNWSGMSPSQVFTVHNGISRELFSAVDDFGLPFPYVLYPGNRRRHKNLDRLLEAFALSSLSRDGVRLVLTGNPEAKLRRKAARLGVERFLHFVGEVSDSDLARLYRGAKLLAFVSLYEGFGLPILEAMASGIPVLTSKVSAMPEVAGGAAVLVNPESTEEIAHALERLVSDEQLRERCVRLGRTQISHFDWDAAASKVWGIVTQAVQ